MSTVLDLTHIEGQMPYASNITLLARSSDGRLWVYKPDDGEKPLWDFEWKSLSKREVLTYEIARAMHLDMVPETRLASGAFGSGSAQAFINEDFEFDPRTLLAPSIDRRLWPFAVLDVICNNADRKLGHVLKESGTGQLWAIDNGLTFHREPKLRTVLWGFAGLALPDELVDGLQKLEEALKTHLLERVAQLLSRQEATALQERTQSLIRNPTHPDPPKDRPPIPWPAW